MKISIVSPVYLAEKIVDELVSKIHEYTATITLDYEIILVEDGSPDNSWKKIEDLCQRDSKLKAIKLSRNFGQHYAITAGLQCTTGKWVIVMDCDLQDNPEEIPNLFQKAQEGFDIVYAQRKLRQDNFFKRLSSNLFYKTFGYLTDSEQDASIANFGIYKQEVIKAVLAMKDHIRFFPTMVQWVGFNSVKLEVKHNSREEGTSSYSWKSLLKLAFNNIISFSDKPLRLTIQLGFSISLLSFIGGLFYIFQYFNGQIKVLGFASIIISICFFSGLIIFILGIIGVYLGKTFDRVKERPTYITSKKINF